MEERKAAKALPFACHFSLTGTVCFFCCFFGRRLAYHPLSLHQSMNIWMNFLQFLRGLSMVENRGSWPQPPVRARAPSSVGFFYFWTPGSVLFGLNLSFAPCWKRRNTTKAETDATSIQHPKCWASLEQSEDIIDYLFRKMNWERGTSWGKLCSLLKVFC